MEQKELTCIGCPMGCQITVTLEDGRIKEIRGNTCKIGEDYAKKEVTSPRRIVTTTVKVAGGFLPVVSVKTVSDVPKQEIYNIIRALHEISVNTPVYIGQVILKDVCGTGVDVIATKDVLGTGNSI